MNTFIILVNGISKRYWMAAFNNLVFVLDVDGVLTPGNFLYNKTGKFAKEFGGDDWDLLKELMELMQVVFITADKKGYPIVKKRIIDEMNWELYIVSHLPNKRWDWMRNKFKYYNIIFMGDGCYDYYALDKCYYGITVPNALDYVQKYADYVTKRNGGQRAVAEACLHIMNKFGFDWKKKYDGK